MPNDKSKGSSATNSNHDHDYDPKDLAGNKTTNTHPIDLTGSDSEHDDDDVDLKLAIALSLQDQQSLKEPSANDSSSTKSHPGISTLPERLTQLERSQNTAQSPSDTPSGLLGLDRKQMEAARLARLKRKRDPTAEERAVSPPSLRRNNKLTTGRPDAANEAEASRPSILPTNKAAVSSTPAAVPASSPRSMPYACGRILLTSTNRTQPRFISFPELLKPTVPEAPLKSALLSSFIFDFDWVFPHFETRKVSFVLALHAQNDQAKELLRQDFADIANVRLVFPYVGANVNCMHSKLMLLFYESATKDPKTTRCRLVVPSANLVPWDWGVGAVVENILFVADLPLRKDGITKDHKHDTEFKMRVIEMLQAMKIPHDVIAKLETFDFSETAKYRFIHSIGGSHSQSLEPVSIKEYLGEKSDADTHSQPSVFTSTTRTGLLSLCDAIRSLSLTVSSTEDSHPLAIDYITSSLGNIKNSFLQELASAASGQDLHLPVKAKRSTKSVQKNVASTHISHEIRSEETSIVHKMKIYFPSDKTVRTSKGGPDSAGTITFHPRWWDGSEHADFRKMLFDCVGVRQDGILLHSKVLFARFAKPRRLFPSHGLHSQQDGPDGGSFTLPRRGVEMAYAGWAYVGSANLSQSAWGSFVLDSKTKQPKLTCRNWECGVLVPIPSKAEHEGQNLHDMSLEEVFGDVIPIPIRYPAENIQDNGERPWFFSG